MSQTVLLVDGMAVLFRAYFATAYGGFVRKTSGGVPVNAIHGFVRYLFDAVRTYGPTHVAVCWDLGSRTFRTERFAAYKGNRPDAPGELVPQFDLVKEVVGSLGVPNVGVPGYEADDCIGTLARRYGGEAEVLILTGDRDLLQLIAERVRVVLLRKGFGNYAVYDGNALYEEMRLRPRQVIDWKGLTGDSSDNYPGVKGIGEKTAIRLLEEHGSVEGILARLEALPASVRRKIEADLDMLHLCRELATIHCEVPLSCELADCAWRPDVWKVRQKFDELEFGGLWREIG